MSRKFCKWNCSAKWHSVSFQITSSSPGFQAVATKTQPPAQEVHEPWAARSVNQRKGCSARAPGAGFSLCISFWALSGWKVSARWVAEALIKKQWWNLCMVSKSALMADSLGFVNLPLFERSHMLSREVVGLQSLSWHPGGCEGARHGYAPNSPDPHLSFSTAENTNRLRMWFPKLNGSHVQKTAYLWQLLLPLLDTTAGVSACSSGSWGDFII